MNYNNLDTPWQGEFFVLASKATIPITLKFNGAVYHILSDDYFLPDLAGQLYSYDPVLFERGRVEFVCGPYDPEYRVNDYWVFWMSGGKFADRGDKPNCICKFVSNSSTLSCSWYSTRGCLLTWEELFSKGYLDD